MRSVSLIILIVFLGIPIGALAIDEVSKKTYPYQLLTDDFGILDGNDLGGYSWGWKTEPFSGKFTGVNYWQCFPTSAVSFFYMKESYSDDDKAYIYNFRVEIKSDKDQVQEYMRARLIPKDFCKEIESEWKELMKGQKYVCFGGSFTMRLEEMRQGKKVQVSTWNFDKIKTKKGCDSYFTTRGHSFCGMTHEEYKEHLR